MVDLPSYTPKGIVAEAPTPSVSARDIEARGNQLAQGLEGVGKGLEDLSVPFAEQAGREAVQKAVTRNPDGSINIDTPQTSFILGRGGEAYSRTVEAGTLAAMQTKVQQDLGNMHVKFAGNPDGFREAAADYTDTLSGNFSGKAGFAIKNLAENYATQHYDTLVNNKAALDLQRSNSQIDTGLTQAQSDLLTLARGGVTSGPQWDILNNQVQSLTAAKTADPRLAYPKETAAYDLDQFHSKLGAQGFLYHVDQVYQGKVPETAGGSAPQRAAASLEAAKSILTDETLKLDPAKRLAYYHQAVGEIRANEAIRKQDVFEARAALSDFNMASATGQPISPDMVESLAQQFRDAGDPAGSARVYAMYARKPLNDAFSRQPLDEQAGQVRGLRSPVGSKPEQDAISTTAGRLGIAPRDLAAVVSYETGGTFDPSLWGGKGDNYLGLIQFGPEERAKYGVKPGMSIEQQMPAVEGFLRDRGVKPGMGLSDIYRTVNGGNPNAPLSASDGNGTIAQHIQRIAGEHYAAADKFMGAEGAQNPANAAWLLTNRSRDLDKNAWASWQTIMKDYNEKTIIPSQSTVDQIVGAAHATNNQALLETIAHDADRMDLAHVQSQKPLPQQQADVTTLKAAAASGNLSPGNAALLSDLDRRQQAVTSGLRDNPIQTAVNFFPERFKAPPPLDFSTPQNLAAGLQYRATIAQFAGENWKTATPSALDQADLNAVKAVVSGPDLAAKSRMMGALSSLPEDVRNATLGKIAENGGPDMAVSVAAGAMMQRDPAMAQSIMQGQMALKMPDKTYWPKGAEETEATKAMAEKLPAATFGLAARTDPQGPLATATGMVKARYADLSAQANDTSGKFDNAGKARLAQAVTDVTGGVLSHNGAPLIAPERGMPQTTFDVMMAGLSDADLPNVTTLNGAPVDANYLRSNAQLESHGDGRYLVRLGSDSARPIYAYQGANTPAPQKFVLDLRGRGVTPAAAQAYRASMIQSGQAQP